MALHLTHHDIWEYSQSTREVHAEVLQRLQSVTACEAIEAASLEVAKVAAGRDGVQQMAPRDA